MSTNTDIETKLKEFHEYLLHRIWELNVMETDAYTLNQRGKETQCYIERQEVTNVEKAFRRLFPKVNFNN